MQYRRRHGDIRFGDTYNTNNPNLDQLMKHKAKKRQRMITRFALTFEKIDKGIRPRRKKYFS